MKKLTVLGLVCVLSFSFFVFGCGRVADQLPAASVLSANLVSSGSLGHIILTWEASTDPGLIGYNVYKSTDEVTFVKTADYPVTTNSYDDLIPAAGDGVYYYYKVTYLTPGESSFSNVTKNIHGTRLPASNLAGLTTLVAASPYVAEGNVVVDGGNLVVASGTKLYLADNSTIDIEQGVGGSGLLLVQGLLHAVASASEPAAITAHRVGGTLADGEGLAIHFDGADNYNASDDSGTLLENTIVTKIRVSSDAIEVMNCSPKFYNAKFYGNDTYGRSYLYFRTDAGAIVKNCYFDKISPDILADLRATAFKMDHNIFRNSYYSIAFFSLDNSGIKAGQIELNDFGCSREVATTNTAYFFDMTGANVPLGNNYWHWGTETPPLPATTYFQSTSTFDFNDPSPALSSVPANVGPSW